MSDRQFPFFTDMFTDGALETTPEQEAALRKLADAYVEAYVAMSPSGTTPRSIHTMECLGVAIDFGPFHH